MVQNWKNILQTVLTSQEKVSAEMDFPSAAGNRVMQVNAIPYITIRVWNQLFVSHDIMERKTAELEIQSKNRKITESINYAKRIQVAILPDNEIIRQVFPDAFILYKPRDVVSGDFPWFMQKGDDLYIAAVDCTGHGVPGALISLIGYFLLNNIVGSKEGLTPGRDQLDYGVTHTLRQDNSDNSTRDGMDIALCKINLKEKHSLLRRSTPPALFFIKTANCLKSKATSSPSGAEYKAVPISPLPGLISAKATQLTSAQTASPTSLAGLKIKFSPKRIRDIITGNHHKNMIRLIHVVFDTDSTWRGDTKQTDDVLMIGIKF